MLIFSLNEISKNTYLIFLLLILNLFILFKSNKWNRLLHYKKLTLFRNTFFYYSLSILSYLIIQIDNPTLKRISLFFLFYSSINGTLELFNMLIYKYFNNELFLLKQFISIIFSFFGIYFNFKIVLILNFILLLSISFLLLEETKKRKNLFPFLISILIATIFNGIMLIDLKNKLIILIDLIINIIFIYQIIKKKDINKINDKLHNTYLLLILIEKYKKTFAKNLQKKSKLNLLLFRKIENKLLDDKLIFKNYKNNNKILNINKKGKKFLNNYHNFVSFLESFNLD